MLIYFLFPGIFMYILDRTVRWKRSRTITRIVSVKDSAESHGITKLTVDRISDMNFVPGQFCLINIPKISKLQWHPFSITSSLSDNPSITFHIKSMGEGTWSGDLSKFSKKFTKYESVEMKKNSFENTIDIKVDGPYGSSDVRYDKYENIIFIAGGIGITAFVSILRSLRNVKSKPKWMKIKKVYLVWTVSKAEHITWFSEILDSMTETKDNTCPLHFEVQLFVTRRKKFGEKSGLLGAELSTTVNFRHQTGRPSFNQILSDIRFKSKGEKSIQVITCGPGTMNKSVEQSCYESSDKTLSFDCFRQSYDV